MNEQTYKIQDDYIKEKMGITLTEKKNDRNSINMVQTCVKNITRTPNEKELIK